MQWYWWLAIGVGVLPAIWVWMAVGGLVTGIFNMIFDGDSLPSGPDDVSDESDVQMMAAFWPLMLGLALVVGLGLCVRHAVFVPGKIAGRFRRKDVELPEAKAVK